MRVVLTGGTGFVGKVLGHAMVAAGSEVVVLTRGEAREFHHACAECGAGAKVELVNWNPEEPGEWTRKIDGADAVIHFAGAGLAYERLTPSRKGYIRSSRIRSTELVARAIAAAEHRPRVFVSGSAVGYYGMETGDREVQEGDPPGCDFLAEVVRDWEAAAAPAADAGVRTLHPRLGMVLGKGGGVLDRMLPLFRAYLGGPLGDGTQYLPWIHVRDVSRSIEHLMDREDLRGPFDITAPQPVTMNEFADVLAFAIERPAAMRIPKFALELAFGERARVVLSGQRALPTRLTESGFAFVFPDLRSALADLV